LYGNNQNTGGFFENLWQVYPTISVNLLSLYGNSLLMD